MIVQKAFKVKPLTRGYHIITNQVQSEVGELPETGLFHLFIKHTSAAITINEAADPDVLTDFESIFNKIVPENMPFLKFDYDTHHGWTIKFGYLARYLPL